MNPLQFTLKDGRMVTLRSIALEDAEAMIAFVNAVDAETRFLAREPGEFAMTIQQEREFIEARLKDEHALMLVAEVDGQIVGSCSAQPKSSMRRFRHRAMLAISVRKAFWRQGIGRRIMTETLRWCKKAGFEQVDLDVAVGNEAAIALYESLGFETTGTYKNAMRYPDGTYADEYYMWLPLDRNAEMPNVL